MKLLLDVEGKVNYDKIDEDSTVQGLLDAIDLFLCDHKLPCDQCGESCCKTSWSVGVDNICVNRLCNWDYDVVKSFMQDKLTIKENISKEFDQYVMKKETICSFVTESNLCTIYERRPIICRLFICSAKSDRYNAVRELIGATYLKALAIEEEIRNSDCTPEEVKWYMRNPAVFTKDYNLLLSDMFHYAQEEGWLDPEDREKLYAKIEKA